jgi:hypothetical protein
MKTFSIYYMTPEFFRDGSMGFAFLKKHGLLPALGALDRTHTFLRNLEARDLEDAFGKMQAEVWSPNGEAAGIIETNGLAHTSMCVGDIAVDHDTWVAHMVDSFGFTPLPKNVDEHVCQISTRDM